MSTLPFLLSVADELDNIHSQSYMDDFGLGFHPHRQYYRSPTIQLSLPASTDWMQQERQQRFRSHKFFDETQNNLQPSAEADDEDATAADGAEVDGDRYGGCDGGGGASTSSAASHSLQHQKYTSSLNSNEDENVDNSVQMYNLSKKCKNYQRHAEGGTMVARTTPSVRDKDKARESSGGGSGGGGSGGGYKLHSKCMEGNNSSSDESLQKVSSSIEFLTCFLLKKSRASKNAGGTSGGGAVGSGKKS